MVGLMAFTWAMMTRMYMLSVSGEVEAPVHVAAAEWCGERPYVSSN